MIQLSAKESVDVELDGVTYRVIAPTVFSRADYQRTMSVKGAVYHSESRLLECLREGIHECIIDEQVPELIELVNSYEFESEKLAELSEGEATEEEKASFQDLKDKMERLQQHIHRLYQPFREMVADRSYWAQLAPLVAFQHFVIGWSGEIDVKYKRRAGIVIPEEVVERIPPAHVELVGWKAITMQRPTEPEAKNSEPQSSSQQGLKISTVEDSPQTMAQDGK